MEIETITSNAVKSIKKVLPALVPERNYKDLDIQGGVTAIVQFAEWLLGTFLKRR